MEVTDEIRVHAEAVYGDAAEHYLRGVQALEQRIAAPLHLTRVYAFGAELDGSPPDSGGVEVETHRPLRTAAEVRGAGWLLVALADADENGWW